MFGIIAASRAVEVSSIVIDDFSINATIAFGTLTMTAQTLVDTVGLSINHVGYGKVFSYADIEDFLNSQLGGAEFMEMEAALTGGGANEMRLYAILKYLEAQRVKIKII